MDGVIILPGENAGLAEHSKVFDIHPELITGSYLNNFFHKFPGGYMRKNELHPERMKLLYRDYLQNSRISSVLSGQTPEYFYGKFDEIISIRGLSCEDLERKLAQLSLPLPRFGDSAFMQAVKDKEELRLQLNPKVIPVYLDLRKLGYNHYDLVR